MTNKIAFITASVNRGGASKVLTILANHYSNLGWQVDFLVKEKIVNEYPLMEDIHRIEFGKLGCGHGLKFLKALRKYLRVERPDIVVSFLTVINIFAIVANIGVGRKIIISERNDPRHSESWGVFIASKILYMGAYRIVFQSNKVKNYYNDKIRRKGCVILNPIEIKCEKKEDDKPIIVTSGRFVKQKNHRLLMDAFKDIHDVYPEYQLVIYGDGVLRSNYKKQIEELGLTDFIHLPGNILEIHKAISDARIFVMSSDYEGLSNSLLEAMAMGFACISTMSGGIEEVMNNTNGIMINVGDKKALTNSLTRLIEDAKYRAELERTAKLVVKDLHVGTIVEKWDCLIDECCEN